MVFRAEIPYGAYWCTPFARWQGSLAHLHSVEFAAHVAKRELARRNIAPERIDFGVLGLSVPQAHAFYGLPWLAGMAGAAAVAGPTIMQACATGVRVLLAATQEIEAGMAEVALGVTCDRTSNGPHLYYPNPKGPGGTGAHEDWVLGQLQLRSARAALDARHRRERRAPARLHGRPAACDRAATRGAVPDGARRRFGISEAVHESAVRRAHDRICARRSPRSPATRASTFRLQRASRV